MLEMLEILKWFGENVARPFWLCVIIVAIGLSISLARGNTTL